MGILFKVRARYQEALREFPFAKRMAQANPPVLFYTGMSFRRAGTCGMSSQCLVRFLNEKRLNKFPKKEEKAPGTIEEECGGSKPECMGRARQS